MFDMRLYPRTIGTRYATFDAAPCQEAGELPVRPPPTKLIARVQEEDRARDEKREFEADEEDRVPLGGRDGKLSARVGVDTLLRQVQVNMSSFSLRSTTDGQCARCGRRPPEILGDLLVGL